MITEFANKVYQKLKQVPVGRVTTYKLLAAAVGCKSSRAVGQALRRNPFAPKVPCHRVIRSDLTIGGFKGKTTGPALNDKLALLRQEGLEFKDGSLLDSDKIYRFIG